jgi:hypothetical protein
VLRAREVTGRSDDADVGILAEQVGDVTDGVGDGSTPSRAPDASRLPSRRCGERLVWTLSTAS